MTFNLSYFLVLWSFPSTQLCPWAQFDSRLSLAATSYRRMLLAAQNARHVCSTSCIWFNLGLNHFFWWSWPGILVSTWVWLMRRKMQCTHMRVSPNAGIRPIVIFRDGHCVRLDNHSAKNSWRESGSATQSLTNRLSRPCVSSGTRHQATHEHMTFWHARLFVRAS